MNFILIIIILSLAEFVGDANFRLYSRNKKFKNLIFALVGYIFVFKFLIEAVSSIKYVPT